MLIQIQSTYNIYIIYNTKQNGKGILGLFVAKYKAKCKENAMDGLAKYTAKCKGNAKDCWGNTK